MRCRELAVAIVHWLQASATPYVLFIDDGEVQLRAHDLGLRLEIALNLTEINDALLDTCLQLAQVSLAHFPAALARSAADGRLWLVSDHPGTLCADDVLDLLEVGLNHRDAWHLALPRHVNRSTLTRLRPPALAQGARHV